MVQRCTPPVGDAVLVAASQDQSMPVVSEARKWVNYTDRTSTMKHGVIKQLMRRERSNADIKAESLYKFKTTKPHARKLTYL